MSTSTTRMRVAGEGAHGTSALGQLAMMTRRSLTVTLRQPATVLPGLLIGVFFLLVNNSSLAGAARLFLPGQSYLGFILPLSVVSASLSAAGAAGQAIVRDIGSGYFDKLLLTPIARSSLLLAPMITAGVVVALQAGVVTLVGLLLGLRPATGVLGLLALCGVALLVGLALAGLVAGVALRTNNAAATEGASFLFFPLTFLTAAYTPVEQLTGWLQTAARINPVTYALEATRPLLNTGWDGPAMARGLLVWAAVALATFAFAFLSLRARTRRR